MEQVVRVGVTNLFLEEAASRCGRAGIYDEGLVTVAQARGTRRHRAQIASLVPGRLRIKLHPASRNADVMQGIRRGLESHEGIQEVSARPANGSVTVRYDRSRHSTADLFGLLEDLDVVIESAGRAAAFDEQAGVIEGPTVSAGFIAAIEDLNARIYAVTGWPIDLKLVLPLAFLGAGIWSIGKKGLMIESVPGWLFLWFAFDIFVKLHPTHVKMVPERSS